jgi:HK97 family phage portal protein
MATASQLLEQLENDFPNTVQQRVRKWSLKDAYRTVSWVYACCNLIADSISGVEFYFFRQMETGERIRVETWQDPAGYCFYPPKYGEIPTLAEMIKMQFLHLGLFGESFLWLRKKNGVPWYVDIINPLQCTPKISKDGQSIEAWKVKLATPTGGSSAKEVIVPLSDIIQWKYPNPYNKFRGMAPLTAARLSIEQDLNMATWNAGFFQNGLRNPIALLLKQTFNDPQRKEYMNRMKQNFMGFVKGQLPLLVEGGVDVRVLQNTMKDLDFVEGKELTREELCAVYNVPPAQVGIFRYANYSNTKEQRTILYQNTLKPKMTYYRDLFQQTILDQYFPGVFCDWEWESVDAFKEDPVVEANVNYTVSQTAAVLFGLGYDQKQISYMLKRPEYDPENHTASVLLEPEIPEPEGIKGPTYAPAKTRTRVYADKSFLQSHASQLLRTTMRPVSGRAISFVKTYFDQFIKTLNSKVAKKSKSAEFWADQWVEGLTPIAEQSFILGIETAYQDLKKIPPTEVTDEKFIGELNGQKEYLMELGVKISKTVIEAHKLGSVVEVSNIIPASLVTHRLFNLGRYLVYERFRVKEMFWCWAGDSHSTQHGTKTVLGSVFPGTDMKFPGDNGDEHCTCTIFPSIIGKSRLDTTRAKRG